MSSDNPYGVQYFPATNWSLVNRASHGASNIQRQAVNELVSRYRPALKSHLVLQKRIDPDRAEDLIQEFLLQKVVAQEIVGRADRERGRFRTFLLVSLNHFVVSQFRAETAAKRGPGKHSLDEAAAVAVAETPRNEFDIAWARQLLGDALERMQRTCLAENRPDIWGVFEARILHPLLHDTPAISYDQLVRQFGLASPAQASNVLITGRRMFERLLRQTIGEYENGDVHINAEIADLYNALSNCTQGIRRFS